MILGLPAAEHLKLGAQLFVFRVGGDVAPWRRLGDDPVGHRGRQRLPLLGRHFLAELLERIPALALEGILGERCLVVGNRLRRLAGGLIEIAAKAQGNRIVRGNRQRLLTSFSASSSG